MEACSVSLDEFREITGSECSMEINPEVVKIILQYKKDMWSHMEMFDIANAFFDNAIRTLEFSTAFENCLQRTRDSQLIIKRAVKQFEEDENGGNERCVRTFEELKKFQEVGDPFTPEFVQLIQSLHKQHLTTFSKLQIERRKLDKKSNTIKTWNKVSNVIFVIAFLSVVTFSIVAAVKSAPPMVIALAAAQAVPLGPLAKWCNTIWSRRLKKIEQENQLITSMQRPTFTIIRKLENIQQLVRIFSKQFNVYANLGIREQGDMQLVIDEIKKNLQDFDKTIEKLSVNAGECCKQATEEKTAILQTIIRYPNLTPPVS